jgi:hypothetical protein
MSMRVIVGRAKIQEAIRVLTSTLKRATVVIPHRVSFRPTSIQLQLNWNAGLGYWWYIEHDNEKDMYWCAYGVSDPTVGPDDGDHALRIDCEINVPLNPVRKFAGTLVEDDAGTIHLAHSGALGGGVPGVSKAAFQTYRRREGLESVVWPDGEQSEMLVLGPIGGKELPAAVAEYVRQAQDFRGRIRRAGAVR